MLKTALFKGSTSSDALQKVLQFLGKAADQLWVLGGGDLEWRQWWRGTDS